FIFLPVKVLSAKSLPLASEVLTYHLKQRKFPYWTSYFIRYKDIINDQRGLSHFNWQIENCNYHILRTGCWPYIKRPYQDLSLENKFFKVIKVLNLGLPCLAYGLGASLLISCHETVHTPKGPVNIYFLYEEDKTSRF
ncbi:Uncharacterized protein Anas_07430, partial [Armadillidium nasatum]